MFSYHEWAGQASYHKTGEIKVNEHYYTVLKPAWLIALKLIGVAAMVAVGYALALPALGKWLPLWQGIVLIAGLMLVYVGVSFFLRPEPDPDNMGIAGGLCNDPFQYSDNINRTLWNLHCLLGPGRFTAETLLDVCAYLGIATGEEVLDPGAGDVECSDASFAQGGPGHAPMTMQWPATGRIDPSPSSMSPDRFSRR